VIIVRAGTYDEKIGWAARAARADARIVLQSYPSEHVRVNGTLSLTAANYWTVKGISFGYSATNTTGQSVVYFAGGTGWSFLNNEVTGTKGVSNVMVTGTTPADSTTTAQTAAAPHDYTISANCIHDAASIGTKGQMHNIYLMPTIYSSGGHIDNNLIGNAPLGANIKASGSSDPNGSPRGVFITHNTLINGSSGIIVGQLAQGIETQYNLISNNGSVFDDGGLRTYSLAAPSKNSIKDTLVTGYASPIKYQWGQTQPMFEARNVTPTPVTFTGSVATCNLRPSSSGLATTYGYTATQ
jgi:hypothetical protein